MDSYSVISRELKAYFESKGILKILLSLDMVLLFASLIYMLLTRVFGLNLGSLASLLGSIAGWAFMLGLILTFANNHQQFLYIGLFGYGALNLIIFFKTLLRPYGYFNWYSLLDLIVYGGLGYLVFKRTVSQGSQDANISG